MQAPSRATLTLPHGIRGAGRFTVQVEGASVIVKLTGVRARMLLTLATWYDMTKHRPQEDRGWLNRAGLHRHYQTVVKQTLTEDAPARYVKRLQTTIAEAFTAAGVELPELMQRDERGWRLAVPVHVVDWGSDRDGAA